MSWTGERLETFIYNETMVEHLHRYALVLDLAKGKQILDIACGEGYGSSLLAEHATSVTAVDIDADTISKAKKKYKKNNLNFIVGAADAIPLEDHIFDYVISFETLEHLENHEGMFQEIKRVLKPEGILVISTPDKKKYSDETGYNNPYHVKELYKTDFSSLLNKHFNHHSLFYQNLHFGSIISSNSMTENPLIEYRGNYDTISSHVKNDGVYIIAIASDKDLVSISLGTSIFDGKKVIQETFERNARKNIRYKIGTWIMSPYLLLKRIFS
jgi:ubiquinone/menaquinone biosynthesis C-methylase UbiE